MLRYEGFKKEIETIAKHYGFRNQQVKLIEELEELLVEARRDSETRDEGMEPTTWGKGIDTSYIEEIADVWIMLNQIILLTDTKREVKKMVEYKLSRQLQRMEREAR